MNKLLDLLEQHEIRSTYELAQALGMSQEMLIAKLECYERLGYVRRIGEENACSGKCKSCKGCTAMKKEIPIVMWEKVRTFQ